MRYELNTVFLRSMRRAALACGGAFLLAGITLTTGCGGDSPKKSAEHHEGDGHKAGEEGHGHAEVGPHQGQLIELGKEEYHGEMLHDDAAHKITIYLLDGEAKQSVPIGDKELTLNLAVDGKPSQYKLPAVPQAGDPAGQTSRYELVDQALCDALDDPKCKGRFNVTIDGKPFSGEITHHDHDHDEHK
jgi:hypothetical protein